MLADPIAGWHHAVETNDLISVEDLLADDAVFQSPAVHAPQPGKALVAKYLRAAMVVLNNPTFKYTAEWRSERSAVLEFELMLDGTYLNGVDIIHWNEQGLITLFKVMVRPLKGLQAVIPAMGAQLQKA
ncbi:MAG: nuclear transport factor 2 family protein [Burkholderiales bacterium]